MRRHEQSPDPLVLNRFARVWPGEPTGIDRAAAESADPESETRDFAVVDESATARDPWDAVRAQRSRFDGSPDRFEPHAAGSAVAGSAVAGSALAGSTLAGPSTATARAISALSPGRRATKALAAVSVMVIIIAAFLAWHSRPNSMPVTSAAPSSPAAGAVHSASGSVVGVGAGPPLASASAVLVVAVEGKVRHPGLVRLPAGARVADAVTAAGGALPGTDLSFVNLAQKVTDGQLILIGVAPPAGVATGTSGSAGSSGGAAQPGAPINLNVATEADLETLPGIGPALAQRILDYRTEHGGFRSVDELRNVSGIGDAKFAEIKDLVTV
ncbi:MAG TPA: helix-hairpin-helix domain-containing protein [Micromonosporaceae bacterium]